jgi:hypothetical protein
MTQAKSPEGKTKNMKRLIKTLMFVMAAGASGLAGFAQSNRVMQFEQLKQPRILTKPLSDGSAHYRGELKNCRPAIAV